MPVQKFCVMCEVALLAFASVSCGFHEKAVVSRIHSALRMAAYRIALNQVKAAEQYRMPPVGHSQTVEEGYTLLTLQSHVLERIFLRLHLTDLARCCQVCKDLQSLVQQDAVWQSLCSTAFPTFTAFELKQWINPTVQPDGWQRASEGAREPQSVSGLLPTSYRSAQVYSPRPCQSSPHTVVVAAGSSTPSSRSLSR